MAMIQCPECGTEVSDKAEKCPKCAYPFSGAPTQEKTQIIELTSKRYKLQKLLSILTLFLGLIIIVASSGNNSSNGSFFGGLFLIAGIIWYIIIRYKIWWHHK
jgi:uncharacterized membrane protein YvbJ